MSHGIHYEEKQDDGQSLPYVHTLHLNSFISRGQSITSKVLFSNMNYFCIVTLIKSTIFPSSKADYNFLGSDLCGLLGMKRKGNKWTSGIEKLA